MENIEYPRFLHFYFPFVPFYNAALNRMQKMTLVV